MTTTTEETREQAWERRVDAAIESAPLTDADHQALADGRPWLTRHQVRRCLCGEPIYPNADAWWHVATRGRTCAGTILYALPAGTEVTHRLAAVLEGELTTAVRYDAGPWVRVSVPVIPVGRGLVVHRVTEEWIGGPLWGVTQARTGRRVHSGVWTSAQAALDYASAIDPLTDWRATPRRVRAGLTVPAYRLVELADDHGAQCILGRPHHGHLSVSVSDLDCATCG